MKANELRLGNWIYNDYYNRNQTCYKITNTSGRTGMKINSLHENFILPIQLTAELLERCGLFSGIGVHNQYFSGFISIKYNEIIMEFELYVGCVLIGITQYLHQLQNLYFALTGEELEINL